MRHVPITEFQANAAELLAAAEAGEEIVITRDGRNVLRIGLAEAERLARQAAAVERLVALGREIRATHGPTAAAEIREWVEEGRP